MDKHEGLGCNIPYESCLFLMWEVSVHVPEKTTRTQNIQNIFLYVFLNVFLCMYYFFYLLIIIY